MLRRIGVEACITSEDVEIRDADRLILPGVGAFDRGMRGLEERGLRDVLTRYCFEVGSARRWAVPHNIVEPECGYSIEEEDEHRRETERGAE